jgi:hypothetical protein
VDRSLVHKDDTQEVNLMNRKIIPLLVASLLVSGFASAQPAIRCGTPEPTAADLKMLRSLSLEGPKALPHPISIPVAMHVITSGRTGKVSKQVIDVMISNLNWAFGGSGVSFYLYKLDYKNNKGWYKSCAYASANENKMKKALAVDPRYVLNIYTCIIGGTSAGAIAGYARFPWWHPESHYLHGVVLDPRALPTGAGFPGYDHYGLTAGHEVGHYLGLFHTFEGGCGGEGDFIADTPAQREPSHQCHTAVDTCSQPGFDDLTNFMNYADDFCRNHFTPGQVDWMSQIVSDFRPSLLR